MKRMLSFVLVLAMILSMAACASKSEAAVAALSEEDLKDPEGQQALTDARSAHDTLVAGEAARDSGPLSFLKSLAEFAPQGARTKCNLLVQAEGFERLL